MAAHECVSAAGDDAWPIGGALLHFSVTHLAASTVSHAFCSQGPLSAMNLNCGYR